MADRDGRVMPAPFTQTDAVVIGATAGIGITALGAAVLISMWFGLRRLLDVRNGVAWDREWAQIRARVERPRPAVVSGLASKLAIRPARAASVGVSRA